MHALPTFCFTDPPIAHGDVTTRKTFRVTDPLWGESTCQRSHRACIAIFSWTKQSLSKLLNKLYIYRWFETLRRLYDVSVLLINYLFKFAKILISKTALGFHVHATSMECAFCPNFIKYKYQSLISTYFSITTDLIIHIRCVVKFKTKFLNECNSFTLLWCITCITQNQISLNKQNISTMDLHFIIKSE